MSDRPGVQRLSESELQACRPIRGEGGRVLRAYCPFHKSDKQRSLRVVVDTNKFSCFACGVWGYVGEGPERSSVPRLRLPVAAPAPPPLPRGDLEALVERYRANLPGSVGERYLAWRGIPLPVAQAASVGYAACGDWAHLDEDTGRPLRQWKYGRLVFPHTDPEGRVVNLYGRAIGSDAVPKGLRHDHLPGSKGYFNAAALNTSIESVHVCEGPFDALSLIAAGVHRVTAIFGVAGWRWEWVRASSLVFAFDADEAGTRWREIAWQAVLRGKAVATLDPAALGGCKDINEAWAAGRLDIQPAEHLLKPSV